MTKLPYLNSSEDKDYVLVHKRTFLTIFFALTATNTLLAERYQCESSQLSKEMIQEAGKCVAKLDESQVEKSVLDIMKA